MVASVMLRVRGMMCFEGPFLGAHTFLAVFRETGSGLSGPRISIEDTIKSTVETILALSTRAVKRYVLAHSGRLGGNTVCTEGLYRGDINFPPEVDVTSKKT